MNKAIICSVVLLTGCCRAIPTTSSDFGVNSADSAIHNIQNSTMNEKEKETVIQQIKACKDGLITCKTQLKKEEDQSDSDVFKMWVISILALLAGFGIGRFIRK